jgi:hypothetical protein
MLIDFGPGSRQLFTVTVNQKVTYVTTLTGCRHLRVADDPPGTQKGASFPVRNNLNLCFSHGASEALAVDQRCLRILFPVPMDIGGNELQPGHASILIHVEDDTRWYIAKEILNVGLWK